MLQSINTNSQSSKALEGVKGTKASAEADGGNFSAELMSQLAAVNSGVGSVAVDPGLIVPSPIETSSLIEQSELGIENPKIFDPTMTKNVEDLIDPELTGLDAEVMSNQAPELDDELTQAMLKTPQLKNVQGRSPAIDLAPSEIDSKLMSMDDFVAQKNLAAKNKLNNAAYGMKPQMQKIQSESGLKSTQVIKDSQMIEGVGAQSQPVNSQQFILGMMSEQPVSLKVSQTQEPQKIFDMSQIKTDNPNQIMNQVTDYIVQAKAAKEPTVNMRLKHDELGLIDITVQKTNFQNHTDGAVAINIGTHSVDGKNFFQANTKDLFSHLTQAGVNVSDLRVETPSQMSKSSFDMNQDKGGSQQFGQDKQFGSEQNQRRHESERRQDLWNLLKDKEAA